jgi:excisionase family DNA binding protein
MIEKSVLNIQELAYYLGLREGMIQQLTDCNEIPYRRVRSILLFRRTEIDQWWDQLPGHPTVALTNDPATFPDTSLPDSPHLSPPETSAAPPLPLRRRAPAAKLHRP